MAVDIDRESVACASSQCVMWGLAMIGDEFTSTDSMVDAPTKSIEKELQPYSITWSNAQGSFHCRFIQYGMIKNGKDDNTMELSARVKMEGGHRAVCMSIKVKYGIGEKKVKANLVDCGGGESKFWYRLDMTKSDHQTLGHHIARLSRLRVKLENGKKVQWNDTLYLKTLSGKQVSYTTWAERKKADPWDKEDIPL